MRTRSPHPCRSRIVVSLPIPAISPRKTLLLSPNADLRLERRPLLPMQTVLNQECVVQSRHNGEEEGGAQEKFGGALDQKDRFDEKQQHKKNRRDLCEGVGLSKNAGEKGAHAGNHEKNATDH